jgi:hypothetical protein
MTGNLSNGQFTFDLGGGNTFFGTYVRTVALPLPPPPGTVAAVSEMFTVTGGTGLFTGASGSLIAAGGLLGTGLAGIAAKVRKRRKAISTSTDV